MKLYLYEHALKTTSVGLLRKGNPGQLTKCLIVKYCIEQIKRRRHKKNNKENNLILIYRTFRKVSQRERRIHMESSRRAETPQTQDILMYCL